jgi:hypothetical protein
MGCFTYTNEMLIINDPKFISHESGQPTLTDAALGNLSECALPFIITQFGLPTIPSTFNVPKVLKDKNFDPSTNNAAKERYEYILSTQTTLWNDFTESISMSMDGWGIMGKFISEYKIAKNSFCNKTLLGEHYYFRATEKLKAKQQPSKLAVLSFTAGYDLPYPIAMRFLEAAGHALSFADNADNCYALVLCTMAGTSMEAKNDWLISKGVEALGSKQRK